MEKPTLGWDKAFAGLHLPSCLGLSKVSIPVCSSFFSVRAQGELLYVLSHSMPSPVLAGRHSHLHLQTRKQPLTSYLTSTIANKSLAPEPIPLFLLPQDSAFLEIAFTGSVPLTQLLRVLWVSVHTFWSVLWKCHVLDSFDLVCWFIKGEWVGRGDGTGRKMFISPWESYLGNYQQLLLIVFLVVSFWKWTGWWHFLRSLLCSIHGVATWSSEGCSAPSHSTW